MKVQTVDGLLDLESLSVRDTHEWLDNARVTATEWFLGEKLVRRDVHVNMLRGLEMGAGSG